MLAKGNGRIQKNAPPVSDSAAFARPRKGPPLMLHALLCCSDDSVTSSWFKERDAAAMTCLRAVHGKYEKQFRPVARPVPATAATTYRKCEKTFTDGPYAETKEQLLGFHIVDVENLEQALEIVRELSEANPGGAYEMRPLTRYPNGSAVKDG